MSRPHVLRAAALLRARGVRRGRWRQRLPRPSRSLLWIRTGMRGVWTETLERLVAQARTR